MNHIVIVGSLNLDFVVQVATLPQPGETISGSQFLTLPGGKGANQACAEVETVQGLAASSLRR